MKRRLFASCFAIALLLFAFSSVAYAGIVDTIEAPTGYFAPDQESLYNDPYYRWYGEGWGWQHNPISGTITSATLNISAWDVDEATYMWSGEVDNIYVFSSAINDWLLLGVLQGRDNDWGYTTFTLAESLFADIALGLQVRMSIDVTNVGYGVALSKSVLSVDGGELPPPDPGQNPSPTPEPGTVLLMGLGFAGLAAVRRFRK